MAKEGFEDLAELRTDGLGVLSGEGAIFLEKVKTEVTPEGIKSMCSCVHCARTNQVTISYEEAVMGMMKFMPPGWDLDQKTGSIYPNVPCAGCQYQMKLLFTPAELKRYLDQAVAEGAPIYMGDPPRLVPAREGIGAVISQVNQRAGRR